MTEAQGLLTTLAQRQEQLAAYFCENKNTFKVEECFKIFSNFISRLQVAVQVETRVTKTDECHRKTRRDPREKQARRH